MNKRLIKKMLKKKEQFDGFIYAEGNNGGDYVKIENVDYGLIDLSVGNCCVTSLNAVVPTEFLSALITKEMLEYNFDINAIIDSFGWDKDFKEKLKAKVRVHKIL